MAKALNDDLMELAAYSRQLLRVDNQPIPYIYDESNEPTNLTLLRLSAELRQAQALERIAAALELTNELLVPQKAAATLDSPHDPRVVTIPIYVTKWQREGFNAFMDAHLAEISTFNDFSEELGNQGKGYEFNLIMRTASVARILGYWYEEKLEIDKAHGRLLAEQEGGKRHG